MEVNGDKKFVHSINLQSVTVMENNKLVRYPLSSVNKVDLAMGREKIESKTLIHLGTL
jgi:hypothetical protein